MADVQKEGRDPRSGTASGLIDFLDWVIDNDYMIPATASALRTGVKKVLEVEPSPEIDIRHAEIDDILHRFRNRNKGRMKDKSVEVYEQRFRQSVDMYRKWLDDKDWLPTPRRRASGNGSSNGGTQRQIAASSTATPSTDTLPAASHGPGMITYPFPIRPGMQGKITLPEDLTRREAERISAFVATLAFDDEGSDAG